MLARDWIPVPLLLCCSAAALAQAHVEPRLSRPVTPRPGFVPAGAMLVSDYAIADVSPTSKFVAVTWQQSFTGPRRLAAYDFSKATNSWAPRPDFNTLTTTTNSDEITITPDLNTIAVYSVGIGPRAYQRAMVGGAWSGAIQIQNLNPTAFSLQFCKVDGVASLLASVTAPNGLELYDFDAATVSVGNPRFLAPPLGNPNNFVGFAIPLADDLGDAHGVLACIRQPLGFQQQFVFADCLRPDAEWSVVFTTPTNGFYTGGDQLAGGHVVAAHSSFGSTLPNGAVDVVGNYTMATGVPATGAWTDVVALGAPGDIGVIAVAGSLIAPTVLPGYTNELGIDPASIAVTWARVMTDGVARFSVDSPPTVPTTLRLQSLMLGISASGFGNTANYIAF